MRKGELNDLPFSDQTSIGGITFLSVVDPKLNISQAIKKSSTFRFKDFIGEIPKLQKSWDGIHKNEDIEF